MRFDVGINLLFHLVLVLSNLDFKGDYPLRWIHFFSTRRKNVNAFFLFEIRHSTSRSDGRVRKIGTSYDCTPPVSSTGDAGTRERLSRVPVLIIPGTVTEWDAAVA